MFHNDVLKTINFCVFLSTYTHYKNTLISIDRAVVRSTRAQISDRIVQIHTLIRLSIIERKACNASNFYKSIMMNELLSI